MDTCHSIRYITATRKKRPGASESFLLPEEEVCRSIYLVDSEARCQTLPELNEGSSDCRQMPGEQELEKMEAAEVEILAYSWSAKNEGGLIFLF